MALIRFTAPTPDLEIKSVPAVFVDFICDIDEDDTERLFRMRYLGVGASFGVLEMGIVQYADPYPQYVSHQELTTILQTLSGVDLVAQIGDPDSDLYQALAAQFATKGTVGNSSFLKSYVVDDPRDSSGIDSSEIDDGSLVILTNVQFNG